MLSRPLRHTALFALTACAVTTAACGLSIVGATGATGDDTGDDATTDHVPHLPGDDDDAGGDTPPNDGSVKDVHADADADAGVLDAADAADAADASAPCAELSQGSTWAGVLGGHCYFVLTDANGPVAVHGGDAFTGCKNVDAHLVTISSQQEEDLVESFGDATFKSFSRWIGLAAPTATTDAGSFAWITGEPVTYTHWESGQPNGDGTCVVLRDGTAFWQDRACDDFELAAICERQ